MVLVDLEFSWPQRIVILNANWAYVTLWSIEHGVAKRLAMTVVENLASGVYRFDPIPRLTFPTPRVV